uniref:Sialate O-acetylesterase domain-containing protein n=1 Tax=Tetradesmus obliquus TaxID=3088 RepID=A0A383VPB6_TETOB|eukprot:jgi/Sobl393_1/11593/SZX67011.1
MDAMCQHLQLSAALLLVLLSPVLVQAGTFSPTITKAAANDIPSRGVTLQDSARAASGQNFTCSRDDDYLNKPNRGYTDYENFVGRWSEGQGWYVAALQADKEKIAKAADPSKVMMCLVGGGCANNGADEPTGMTGCEPGPRPGNPKQNTTCKRSWRKMLGFAANAVCSMAAMMAAPRNGGTGPDAKGLVGIWPGAQLHIVNAFQDDITVPWTSEFLQVGYTECLAEFRARRAAGRPDLKLLLFTQGVMDVAADEPKAKAMIDSMLAEFPNDVLLFSQLYPDQSPGIDTYTDKNFPSTEPAYIAVGGVDERGSRTPPPYVGPEYMSGFGPALDFVGPALMVLTYPTGDETTGGFYDEGYISTDPDINPVDYPNMIRLPILRYSRTNMSRGPVTGGIVDCGDGTKPCAGAKGKICLVDWFIGIMSSPDNSSYGKLGHIATNCVAGGGVGVIMGNNAETDAAGFCNSYNMNYPDDPEGIYPPTRPDGLYPTTIFMSRRNFLHLKQAVAAGKVKSATIRGRQADPLQLTFVDDLHVAAGGVMAATAMVWSAHPACTGAQVRKAVELTATNKGKRNNETGWGMPQALAAHEYLLANPCTAADAFKLDVSYAVVRNSNKDGKACHGSTVKVTATLTSGGKPVAGQAVTIVVNEPWMLLACKQNSRTACRYTFTGKTNAQGAFSMSGKVRVKGGNGVAVTVWAKTSGPSGQVTSQVVSIPIAR